jgi:hypothetical protein
MAECKENVGRGIVSFPCYLEPGHDGPHVSRENLPSQHARRAWELATELEELESKTEVLEPQALERQVPHPGAESIRVFQGEPKTSRVGLVEHGPPMVTVDTNAPGQGRVLRTTRTPHVPTTSIPQVQVTGNVGAPIFDADRLEKVKDRPEDQRLPTVREGVVSIQSLVIEDIEAREAVGIQRYGTPLQPFNDRDSNLDLYEELLDATMYARQLREERNILLDTVLDLADDLGKLLGSLPITVNDKLRLLIQGLDTAL